MQLLLTPPGGVSTQQIGPWSQSKSMPLQAAVLRGQWRFLLRILSFGDAENFVLTQAVPKGLLHTPQKREASLRKLQPLEATGPGVGDHFNTHWGCSHRLGPSWGWPRSGSNSFSQAAASSLQPQLVCGHHWCLQGQTPRLEDGLLSPQSPEKLMDSSIPAYQPFPGF